MERFIVSARKYRPATFDTVVGQPHITQTLKNAILHNHLAQAFLFTGPRGVGKTTTARILAKTINCQNLTASTEACDQCESCVAFNTGHSLNIYELDAASNNSVDDIRALVEQVRYAPQMGRYKVYIIDEVHMLSASAFNAFLKTLEEPPSYAVFILATTEKHKIIPTILSRCQIFDFSRITVDDIARHLKSIAEKEQVAAEEEALHVIARKADGALRDALSMFDQLVSFSNGQLTYKAAIDNLNILDYDYYFRIIDDVIRGNMAAVLMAFDEILAHGFDAHHFVTGMSSHLRDLLMCKDEVTLPLLEVSPVVRDRYKVQAAACSAPWLLELLERTHQADLNFKSARHQRLHVEYTLMKLCSVGKSSPATAPATTATSPAAAPSRSVSSAPATSTPTASAAPAATASTVAEKTPVASAKPASPPPPSPVSSSGAARSSTSIRISGAPNKESEKKNDSSGAAALKDLPREPISPVSLSKAWKKFGQQLNDQGRYALSVAMLKRELNLTTGETATFVVDSPAIEKDMQEVKSDLLQFLRQSLNNFYLNIEITVELTDNKLSVPYTPSEKFTALAQQYPALNELKKRLDLDLEY